MPKRKKSRSKHPLQAQSGTPVPSTPRLRVLAGAVLILLAVFLAYLPALNGGFLLDDHRMLTANPLFNAADSLYRFWCTTESQDYWPVTNTSLWIEWRLWGTNTTGYHVVNLALHVVEALLIWIILSKLSIPGAFLAAFLFAVHPVNVESVAWISQRKNMLAMLFFLLSILCYLNLEILSSSSQDRLYWKTSPLATRHSLLWYWLSLVAFVLAMLSKGSVAVLPVLLLGIIWWRRPLTKWDLARITPFFLVAVVLTGVNLWFQTHGTEIVIRNATVMERLLGAGGVVWFYLYKALLPLHLSFIYPEWQIKINNLLWWLPLLSAVITTAVLWHYRQSWGRPFLFAWGFFCVSLVPVLGFTDVGFMKYSLVSDHYQHIAIIGVIALLAAGWSGWHKHAQGPIRWKIDIVAVVVAATLTFLTYRQSELYNNAERLYEATLEKNPACWMAHNNLGNALSKTGRLPEAIEHLQQAIRLNPELPEPQYNLGNALNKAGRLKEAIEHYEQSLRLRPDYPEAQNNLGLALFQTGRPEEAIEHLQQAIRLNPNYPDAHNNLGVVLVDLGRHGESIKHFQETLRLIPDHFGAYANLVKIYVSTNQRSEAVAAAKKARDIARSQGQTALVKQIEDWLNTYRTSQSRSQSVMPTGETTSPPP